jgi:hypothetical protein
MAVLSLQLARRLVGDNYQGKTGGSSGGLCVALRSLWQLLGLPENREELIMAKKKKTKPTPVPLTYAEKYFGVILPRYK